MKCPHCQEELGLNNICINPVCSHFGATIESSAEFNINNTENNYHIIDDTNKCNPYNPNLNSNNNHTNKNDYNIDNTTNRSSSNIYNNSNNNISREEFAAFIGSHNTDYYLNLIPKMENNNRFLSWNWSCFFLGCYWLLYRKIYVLASILIIFNLAFSKLFSTKISILVMIIIRIVLTMFANSIYLNHSKNKIKLVKASIRNLSASQYINRLHKKGGINLAAPIIVVFIYILIAIISMFLFFLYATTTNPSNFSAPSYHY